MPQAYKVKLTGPGMNIEREVPEAIAQQLVMLTLGADRATAGSHVQQGDGTQRVVTRPPGQEMAIAESLAASEAQRSPEKVTAIALYLKEQQAKATFSIPDLKKGFVDAGESVPGNLPRDINWAKKVGWIAPKPGQRGTYYVTTTGTQAVKAKFPPEVRKKTKLGRRKKRRAKGGATKP